ncbi:hypothetical protein V8F20_005471 [Naviculisporaceae sp. PSN 640]
MEWHWLLNSTQYIYLFILIHILNDISFSCIYHLCFSLSSSSYDVIMPLSFLGYVVSFICGEDVSMLCIPFLPSVFVRPTVFCTV